MALIRLYQDQSSDQKNKSTKKLIRLTLPKITVDNKPPATPPPPPPPPKTTTQKIEEGLVNAAKATGAGIFQASKKVGLGIAHAVEHPVETAQNITHTVEQVNKGIEQVVKHPIQTMQNVLENEKKYMAEPFADSVGQTYQDAVQRFSEAADTLVPNTPWSTRVAKMSGAGLGVANVLFSPIGGLIAATQNIPIVKYGANGLVALNDKVIMPLAGGVTNWLIDRAPISQEAKDNLKPAAKEIAGFASQILLAHGAGKLYGGAKRFVNEPTDYLNTTNVVRAITEDTAAKEAATTPKTTGTKPTRVLPSAAEPRAIEPLPPTRSLKLITPKTATYENLPTGTELFHKDLGKFKIIDHVLVPTEKGALVKGVRLEDVTGQQADFTLAEMKGLRKIVGELNLPKLQNIAPTTLPENTIKTGPIGAPESTTIAPKAPESPTARPASPEAPVTLQEQPAPFIQANPSDIQSIAGTGDVRVRGVSSSVEARAISEKLTKGFSDLPEYRGVNMEDQGARAQNIVNTNYSLARDIAMGKENAPQGVIPESVFIAVENKAIATGDVGTLHDLATQSKLAEQGTVMGQRLRAYAERNPESPVEAIKKISETRAKAAGGRVAKGDVAKTKAKTVERIKGEIKKAVSEKPTWEKFIKDLQC